MTSPSEFGSGDPEGVPLPKAEWNAHVAQVTTAMQEYTKKFVTPISLAIEYDYGELLGTGNYVDLRGQKHLLTNEHVAKGVLLHSLAHQFLNSDTVFRASNPFQVFTQPLDVAVSVIDENIWRHVQHNSAALPEEKWAIVHTPVKGEILFFKGFSGERARFHFGHLFTQATSYGVQEVPLPAEDRRLNSRFHFALDYRPALATPINGDTRGLPLPTGFSGSLVWNTRFVELREKGNAWTPDCAEVTGLVWGWPPSRACIVATRAEYLRSFLLRATNR